MFRGVFSPNNYHRLSQSYSFTRIPVSPPLLEVFLATCSHSHDSAVGLGTDMHGTGRKESGDETDLWHQYRLQVWGRYDTSV